ncbi:MAG: T9SS type A sorting domain-containing protein [Candidatus Eisenbacteria bacterium]|nr:T9SS type A sorting domain-containing protein [Candidatus Eisenbacteria bacterium]
MTPEQQEATRSGPDGSLVPNFGATWHNVGKLILHVSNFGVFGTRGQFSYSTAPSAEWPPGSSHDYLWAAGLWVGGTGIEYEQLLGTPDTLVSTGIYFWEYRPDTFDPVETIYQTWEGRPGGARGEDDDGDGDIDEDPLDGRNNDPWNDTRIDEDHYAISQQMYRCVYYDTSQIRNQFYADPNFFHWPLHLKVTQESYQWVGKNWDDFVGIEFRIENIGNIPITDAYVGFMVDSDVGNGRITDDIYLDDLSNFIHRDTTLVVPGRPDEDLSIDVAYMRDAPGGDDGDEADGLFGVMFLGHTIDSSGVTAPERVEIHAYKSWSGGDEDPDQDRDRYRYLRGSNRCGNRWCQDIDPAEERADDYRMLLSAGPFIEIMPGDELVFQSAFVMLDPRGRDRDNPTEVGFYMMENAIAAQRIFNRGWTAASAPPPPNQRLIPGDHRVTVEWDDFSELTPDPLSGKFDFQGYQVWKAEGWRRESAEPQDDQWFLLMDIDRSDLSNYDTGGQGVGKYRFVDTDVKNGFAYWYAITAYDKGDPEEGIEAEYGKFSQAKNLVFPRFNPTRSLDDAVDVYEVDGSGEVTKRRTRTDVNDVHVVPNPYKERAAWDEETSNLNATGRKIYFVNLPERATITIYTMAGDLVQTVYHDYNDNPEEDFTYWNLVSRNNQEVVSGVYIYHIDSDVGEKVGRFVIIR